MNFVHLHLHTEYSLTDGLVRIKPLMQKVAEKGMSAVALTDRNNMFAAVKFYRAALEYGIKPILGAEVEVEIPGSRSQTARAVLLCQNAEGYRNLCILLSDAYRSGRPVLTRQALTQNSDGLIALSGAMHGDLGYAAMAEDVRQAKDLLGFWRKHFPDRFYIEATRTDRDHEDDFLEFAAHLAEQDQVPMVATNDVRFLDSADFEAHEVRSRISQGTSNADRVREFSKEQYLRETHEMQEVFSDWPESLITHTEHIAVRCNFQLQLGRTLLPAYPRPSGKSIDDYLNDLARDGLARRLELLRGSNQMAAEEKRYQERLDKELEIIHGTGFSGYFVIVMDFVDWARRNQIPVGPGRGSGAGSLVAYSLRITGLDPLRYGLLFERFLNPERYSMPDFDIDFCQEERDRVIDYVRERYGQDNVAQIITYGTMAAKAVVRDVGRALGAPYGYCDRIARSIPNRLGITLAEAYKEDPEFKKLVTDPEQPTGGHLYEVALELEGIVRNASRHAAGVVISPTPMTDYLPLYYEPRQPEIGITQFDMADIEMVGLTKFDFLGLRTLTLLNRCLQTVNARRAIEQQEPLDLETLPLDDERTFQLLRKADTVAVFQLESEGIRELTRRMRPDHFDDLVALVALYRPGPLNSKMDDVYIRCKHDPSKVSYLHADIKPILEPTFGVMLYQEQVMQMAQKLAGFSLGEADLLRRAMGKKKPEEMAKHREQFEDGAVDHGLKPHQASRIFDQMQEFAEYGFNKSHSVAYALLAYQTAWFKAHYPDAFMAAALSSEIDTTDRLKLLRREACDTLKLDVLPPHVNESEYYFTVPEPGKVRYGLGALKGVGRNTVQHLTEMRGNQPYADLEDLCLRLDTRYVGEKEISTLIHAGALDDLGANRHTMAEALKRTRNNARRVQEDRAAGQESLFGVAEEQASPMAMETFEEYSNEVLLQYELEALGFYLSGHPFDSYRAVVQQIGASTPTQILEIAARATALGRAHNSEQTVAGVVVKLTYPRNREVVFAEIEDSRSTLEVAIVDVASTQNLKRGDLLIARGRLRILPREADRGARLRLRAETIQTRRDLEGMANGIRIILEHSDPNTVRQAREMLARYPGSGTVQVVVVAPQGRAEFVLPDNCKVQPNEQLLEKIRGIPGVIRADHLYSRLNV